VRGAAGRVDLERLRSRRQPVRSSLRRLGHRERGQRPLLRAGSRARMVDRRHREPRLAMRSGSPPRYDGVAIALHWVLGLALVAQIAFGFMLDTLAPRGTPARTDVINLHKSTGIALGVLIVLRMAWRL